MSNRIYSCKKRIIKAFEDISFEYFQQLIPYGLGSNPTFKEKKLKEEHNSWIVWYAKEEKTWTEDFKESIKLISGIISVFKMQYNCLWSGWAIARGANRFKETFKSDFIKASWEQIEPFKDAVDRANIVDKKQIEYGYFLVQSMLNTIDELYLRMLLLEKTVNLINTSNLVNSRLVFRFNNISLRGSRRVKIWDIFVESSKSSFSRTSKPGRFYTIHPENLPKVIDKDKVPDILKCKSVLELDKLIPALHPHISDSQPCLGAWENKFSLYSSIGWSNPYFKAIKGFLCTWTPESPFWNINSNNNNFYINSKSINFTSIDYHYLYRILNFKSGDWVNNHDIERILCTEKIDKGYWTTKTLSKLRSFIRINDKDFPSWHILSQKHNLPTNFDYNDSYASNVKKNPYKFLQDLSYNGFSININEYTINLLHNLKIQRGISSYNYCLSDIFATFLYRIKLLITNKFNEHFSKLTYNNLSYIALEDLTESISNDELLETNNEFCIRTKEGKVHPNLDLSGLKLLEKENLKKEFILYPEILSKTLLLWLKTSIEGRINTLNKEKEDYNNELINITQNYKQSELFS